MPGTGWCSGRYFMTEEDAGGEDEEDDEIGRMG